MIGYIKPIEFIELIGDDGGPAPLAPATHFVSLSETNGYAVGVNSGPGDSKQTPWLTLAYAITNAPSGSIICVNDGTYAAATFFSIADKSLEIRAENTRAVTLNATGAQVRIINFTTAAAGPSHLLTLRGLVLDGLNTTTRALLIGTSTPALGVYAQVEIFDCTIRDVTQSAIRTNVQKSTSLTVSGLVLSGAFSSPIIHVASAQEGDFSISNVSVSATATADGVSVVDIQRIAGGSGMTVLVSKVTGDVSNSVGSNLLHGVTIANVDDAKIENCDLNISGSIFSGWIYRIFCTSTGMTANRGAIRRNHGYNGNAGGYCALIGSDASSAGDGRHNDGVIAGNTFAANPASATPIHGIMLGWSTGGEAYDNTVQGCGLATIAKQNTGAHFYNNEITQASSEAFRAKGATNAVWENNTVIVSAGHEGDCVNVNIDGAVNSTGIEISGNTFVLDAAPGNIVDVETGSTALFADNTYTINVSLGSNPWRYHANVYQTLAEWKAVEPTAKP